MARDFTRILFSLKKIVENILHNTVNKFFYTFLNTKTTNYNKKPIHCMQARSHLIISSYIIELEKNLHTNIYFSKSYSKLHILVLEK